MERTGTRATRPTVSLALMLLWLACFLYLALASRLPELPWVVGRGQTVAGPGHFFASFILTALIYGWLRSLDLARRPLPIALVALIVSAAIGGLIELSQFLAPSRQPQLGDWLIDVFGSAAGVLFVLGFDLRRKRRHRLVVGLQLGGGVAIALTLSAFAIWPPEGGGPAHIFSSRADYERCVPDEGDATRTNVTPGGRRVGDGLVALYTGSTDDVASTNPPLDLQLEGNVSLAENALRFEGGVARSVGPAEKIRAAALAASAFTIEAWARPATVTQGGPARIVSVSDGVDPNLVNFHLGQEEACLSFRVGTGNGSATWVLVDGVFDDSSSARHLVATYEDGKVKFFVDGERVDRMRLDDATLEYWDDGYPLLLGNETSMDRPFLGEIFLVGFYGRALTDGEVEANYQAGAG
jgi:VanZ family protein